MKFKILFFVSVFIFATSGCGEKAHGIVAWVGDQQVTISEMKHWMLLEKANVYNYFYRKYKIEDSKAFWIQQYGGEIPLEKLRSIALTNAKRHKIQQILALERGIIETANFDEIVMKKEKINRERKTKVQNGEPVFGPVQFTSRSYYAHVFDKMVINLKYELSKNELKPTENEVKLMQTRAAHAPGENDALLTMHYVDKHYDAYIGDLMNNTVININEDAYNRLTLD